MSRMLSGLRQYGYFSLPARADMNDVLAALAREAGWMVEPDGTTYRSPLGGLPVRSSESPLSASSLKDCSTKASYDCQPTVLDETLSPASLDSVVVTEMESKSEKYTSASNIESPESLKAHRLIQNVQSNMRENDYSGTPHVPVYIKLSVVLAFHEFGGSNSGNVFISLPPWVLEIGKDNQDIFFTDREGQRNTGCVSWGIDKERAFNGRTGIEVYFDFMRSFSSEFDDIIGDGLITAVEIGLGESGELKFPSFPERLGWRYPGVGEFQCYDRYLQQNLRTAAKLRGHSFWARGPDNAGHYNSRPPETGFFCERGDYDSYFGRFFLHWYAQMLIDHADNVLLLASLAFEDIQIVVKIPAVYWWYKTPSHAAELTAGYYNPTNRDGYSPIFGVLRKHCVTLKFVCPRSYNNSHENHEPLSDPEGLSWQVLNAAWDCRLTVAGQNVDPCFDRGEHIRVVGTSKPNNDPDRRHFSFFVYQLPSPFVQRTYCFSELDNFVKSIHGQNDVILNLLKSRLFQGSGRKT